MKKVVVRIGDRVVVNVIEIEDDANYQVKLGYELIDYQVDAEIGGTFVNEKFLPRVVVPDIPDAKQVRRSELQVQFRVRAGTSDEIQEFLADHIGD